METIVLKCISYYKVSYLPPGALNIHNVFKQTPRIKRYISGPPYQLQSWAKQLIGDEAFSFGDKQIYWPDHCTGIKCVPCYYWGWGDDSYSYIIGLKPFFIKKFFLALGAKENFVRVDNPGRSDCALKNSENLKKIKNFLIL